MFFALGGSVNPLEGLGKLFFALDKSGEPFVRIPADDPYCCCDLNIKHLKALIAELKIRVKNGGPWSEKLNGNSLWDE